MRSAPIPFGVIFVLILFGCGPTAVVSDPDQLDSAAQSDSNGNLKSDQQEWDENSTSSLSLLVVGDAELTQAIRRIWASRSSSVLQLTEISEADAADQLNSPDFSIATDAVICPPRFLGVLVERAIIQAMPARVASNDQLALGDVFPTVAEHEICWGGKTYAVPFGSPHLCFVYRSDVLDRLGVAPPSTWRQVSALQEQLADPDTRRELADLVSAGAAVDVELFSQPLAAESLAMTFLARAAAYAVHPGHYSALFDYRSMKPLVDQAPFVRALEELVAGQQHASPASRSMTPALATDSVCDGKSLMAIGGRPTRGRQDNDDANDDANASRYPVAVAELPGADEVFNPTSREWERRERAADFRVPLLGTSGRVGCVVARTRRTRGAWNLLVLLASLEWGVEISPASFHTSIARPSQVASAGRWWGDAGGPRAVASFGSSMSASSSRRAALLAPRIPGQRRYMEILTTAVERVLDGEILPGASLTSVAREWEKLTDEIGREEQIRAYCRSLGVEP